LGGTPPAHLPRWLLARVLAQRMQVATLGDLDRALLRMIRQAKGGDGDGSDIRLFARRDPATRDGVGLKAGALLVREWNGAPQRVMVLEKGFAWNGKSYASPSQIAKAITGTSWNGHRFFGLGRAHASVGADSVAAKTGRRSGSDTLRVATIAAGAATIAPAPSPPICLRQPTGPGHLPLPGPLRLLPPLPLLRLPLLRLPSQLPRRNAPQNLQRRGLGAQSPRGTSPTKALAVPPEATRSAASFGFRRFSTRRMFACPLAPSRKEIETAPNSPPPTDPWGTPA
jgi:hypothetical protein